MKNPVLKLARAEKTLSIKFTELKEAQKAVNVARRAVKGGRISRSQSFANAIRREVANSTGSFTSRSITAKVLGKDTNREKVKQAGVVLLKMAKNGVVNRTFSADVPRGQMVYTKAN